MADASRPPAIDLRRALAVVATVLSAAAVAGDDGRRGEAPIGISAALLPLAGGDDSFRLASVVEVPLEAFAVDGAGTPRPLEIVVELRDGAGVVRGSHRESVAFAGGVEAGAVRGVRLLTEFRVAPGRLQLVATAGDGIAIPFVSRPLHVDVPDTAGRAWVASTPLVADGGAAWKSVRAATSELAAEPFPFVDLQGGAFLPAATIATDDQQRVRAVVLIATADGQFPFLRAQLTDSSGAQRNLPVAVLGLTPSVAPGVVVAEIEIGASGAAGSFGLRLGFGRADGEVESPFAGGTELRVRPPADGLRVLVDSVDAPVEEAAPVDGEMTSAHLRILDRLAQDGVEPAAEELVLLSKRQRAASGQWRLRDLRAAQVQAMAQRGIGPETLPAIVSLHLRAAERFVEVRDVWWTAQERQFLRELLRPASEGRDAALRGFAADALALAVPEAALEIDPAHPLAVLRSVRDLERQRRHSEAIALLDRLLARQPSHPEARLRKAIVLSRSDANAARGLLAALTKEDDNGWVGELAHAELAKLERAAGRRKAAIETLRRGIERVPAQALFLQLAFYLEEEDRTSEAAAVIHRLPIGSGGDRPAARHLYALGGVDEFEATRLRVETRATDALRRLRELRVAANGGGE